MATDTVLLLASSLFVEPSELVGALMSAKSSSVADASVLIKVSALLGTLVIVKEASELVDAFVSSMPPIVISMLGVVKTLEVVVGSVMVESCVPVGALVMVVDSMFSVKDLAPMSKCLSICIKTTG